MFPIEVSPLRRLEDDGVRDTERPRGPGSHEEAEVDFAEVYEGGAGGEGSRWEEFPDCELAEAVESSDKSVEPD